MTDNETKFSMRIMGMMQDYQCTMQEALIWDFESFEFDIRKMGRDLLKDKFQFYLLLNGIDPNSDLIPFYTDIILGIQNFAFRKAKVK